MPKLPVFTCNHCGNRYPANEACVYCMRRMNGRIREVNQMARFVAACMVYMSLYTLFQPTLSHVLSIFLLVVVLVRCVCVFTVLEERRDNGDLG